MLPVVSSTDRSHWVFNCASPQRLRRELWTPSRLLAAPPAERRRSPEIRLVDIGHISSNRRLNWPISRAIYLRDYGSGHYRPIWLAADQLFSLHRLFPVNAVVAIVRQKSGHSTRSRPQYNLTVASWSGSSAASVDRFDEQRRPSQIDDWRRRRTAENVANVSDIET